MKIKEEYTVFVCSRHGSGIYYCRFELDKESGKFKKYDGYTRIPYFNKFDSLPDAGECLKKLKDSCVCRPAQVYVINRTREDEVRNAISNAMWDKNNEYKEVAFICRIPDEYYLGSKWCETLKYMGDTRYSDDKPYQLRGAETSDILAKDKWLLYNSPSDFRWVDNRFEASFFDEDGAERVQKIVNGIRKKEVPYKGYVRIDSLPLRIENEQPKYQKGDKAFILDFECIRNSLRYAAYEGKITDVMVELDKNGKKRYVYAFDNNPYAEKFIESRYFRTERELVSEGGKFHYGMHNGLPYAKLLDFESREYVVYQ